MPRPVLLTGSAGFVGRHLAPLLREAFADRELVEVVRRCDPPPGGYAVDLTDRDATQLLLQRVRPALVVHLAAQSSVAKAADAPDRVWRTNRDGTESLALAIAEQVPDAIVLAASTAEVYGRNLEMGPASEATPPRPSGAYAASKRAAELVLERLLPPTARLILARPFNHTGPGQAETFVVGSFAAQIARIEAGRAPPIIHVGNLATKRDFLDVRDVAASYVALLCRAQQLPSRAVVNVARGEAVSIGTVLKLLLSLSSASVEVRVDPARLRPDEIGEATARPDLLAGLIPWPPERPLIETLRDVLEDHRHRTQAMAS